MGEAIVQGVLDIWEAIALRKSELKDESEERISQCEALQSQINSNSSAILRASFNLYKAIEARKTELQEAISLEHDDWRINNNGQQIQIDTLAEAVLMFVKNFYVALERRKSALQREEQARLESDDVLQRQIDINTTANLKASFNLKRESEERRKEIAQAWQKNDANAEFNRYLDAQVSNLVSASIKDSKNLHGALERQREAFYREKQSQIESDEVLQRQLNTNAQAGLRASANLVREAAERRKLAQAVNDKLQAEAAVREDTEHCEAQSRYSDDSALQSQLEELVKASLSDQLRLLTFKTNQRAVMQVEVQNRLTQDGTLQEQIDALSTAVTRGVVNDSQAHQRLSTQIAEIKQKIDEIYDAIVDTGQVTYRGAKVATSHEIKDMLSDVMSGNNDGETSESVIPEELQSEIATHDEISEMLDEVLNT